MIHLSESSLGMLLYVCLILSDTGERSVLRMMSVHCFHAVSPPYIENVM